jgi:hypothetical protein
MIYNWCFLFGFNCTTLCFQKDNSCKFIKIWLLDEENLPPSCENKLQSFVWNVSLRQNDEKLIKPAITITITTTTDWLTDWLTVRGQRLTWAVGCLKMSTNLFGCKQTAYLLSKISDYKNEKAKNTLLTFLFNVDLYKWEEYKHCCCRRLNKETTTCLLDKTQICLKRHCITQANLI